MKYIPFAILILLAGSHGNAAVVFEGPFDSKTNWVKVTGDITESVSNGRYIVENTGASACLLKHDMTPLNTFTYSVKFTALGEHSFLGISFCVQASTMECYIFTLRNTAEYDQSYTIFKLTGSGGTYSTTVLKTGWNSFIDFRTNDVKVSKSGNRIDLFCNGIWLDSLSDNTFQSGSVGLVIGAGESVAFDKATVTDQYMTGKPPEYFVDDFNDGALGGWDILFGESAGDVTIKNGALRISAGPNARDTKVITNGSYKNVPVRAVVTNVNGDTAGFYGLMLMKTGIDMTVSPPVNFYDAFVFKIDGNRQYVAYYLSQDSIYYTVHPPNSAIHGTTDTLLITPDYQFVVNGVTLPDIDFSSLNFDFNAVGFIVDSSVTVDFDNFAAGDSTKPLTDALRPKNIRPAAAARPVYEIGGSGIIYDIRGRIVSRYNGDFMDSVRTLGSGRFFILPDNTEKNGITRAIVQIR